MARLLVLLLLCVNALPFTWAISQDAVPPMLPKDDERDPQAVAAWLMKNGKKADRAKAVQSFEDGLKYKRRKDWGNAVKAFGDSVGFFPAPRAFNELTEARLLMLRDIRQRKSVREINWRRDIQEAEISYRNALMSDAIVKQLTSQERRKIEWSAECLGIYLENQVKPINCWPLKLYGIEE